MSLEDTYEEAIDIADMLREKGYYVKRCMIEIHHTDDEGNVFQAVEGVLIKTADPSITCEIYEIEGKYFVKGLYG